MFALYFTFFFNFSAPEPYSGGDRQRMIETGREAIL
jgi:hypothetical protein